MNKPSIWSHRVEGENQSMPLRTFLVVCLATCLLLGGCTSSEKTSKPGAVATQGNNPETGEVKSATTQGGVMLELLPEQPTVLNPLALHVSGAEGVVTIRWEKNGQVLEGQTSARLSAELFSRGDVVTAVVSTAAGEARAQTTIGNAPPRVTQVVVQPAKVYRGVNLTAEVQGEDPDGDRVEFNYAWSINGEALHWEQGPQLSGDKFSRGDRLVLQVTPFDGKVGGKVFKGVDLVVDNAPPKFVSTPTQTFQGMSYHYDARAEDPDGDLLTYALESAPPGMVIDSARGTIEWTVDRKGAGEYKVNIAAKDAQGLGDVQEFSLVLSFK